ncbi:hypothetical protein RUM44_006731 [Polyplax serrata]|uniref:Uncharacterized protein n=1 Tax=Polyplax serrata TaxID=468196 RepID=A0ABR1AIW0_POLSC
MVNKKKEVGDLLKSYLQRPYYWSWGGGSGGGNATNRWPKKEDKLRKSTGRATAKPVKMLSMNSTEDYGGFESNANLRNAGLFTEDSYTTNFRTRSTATTGHFMFGDITNALSIRSTTVDYQIDRKQPKWNFNFSIG